ncbi:MAG: ester cyclase [Methanomicrobiales archaeon]|nr:ester cyclase [Methanomicrobiales archaeon]
MSGEGNKELFRRVIEEGYNKGNLETLNELFSPSFIEHQDGIIAEHWGVADRFSLMQQLGVIPGR